MRRGHALLLAALLAAAAVAYLPAVDGDFLFDDEALLQDPLVRAPLDHGLARWAVAPRPLSTLTFAANHAAVGFDPRGWHLTSLALHLATALLAFAFVRITLARAGLARPDGPALAAAALFALHPLQSEAVAYLSQRAEVLASALYLAALLLLLVRDGAGRGRRAALLAGAAALQALGALAKPVIATLPAAWLLHAALLPAPGEEREGPLRRVRARLLAAAPLLALSAASAARELLAARGSTSAGLDLPGLGPLAYLATEATVVPTYLRLALWPAGQCGDWDVRPVGPGHPLALAGALLIAGAAVGALLLWRRCAGEEGDLPAAGRAAAFGGLFFLVALAPSSSVVPLLDPLAEHRVYLALLGLAVAAAAVAAALLRGRLGGRAPAVGLALGVAVALALGAATARRAEVWTTRLAFWSDAAAKAPGKARVQANHGAALLLEGRTPEAIAALRRARLLAADGTVPAEQALGNLVGALVQAGRFDEARRELEGELARSPRAAGAMGRLAEVELQAGRPDAAERWARRALAEDPREPVALASLGFLRADAGDLLAARALLRAAMDVRPADTRLPLELGLVEERLGDRVAACEALVRARDEAGWSEVSARARDAAARLRCGR